MLIDWFTVVAQAVNFIILVWLLKRFLYKPILDAVDAREKRIEAALADADAKKAEALKERDAFLRKNEAFDGQRAALLATAETEANAERRRLLDEARRAADALSAQRQQALRSEARDLSRAIGERTQKEVFAISRKALMDLASTTLEERMGDVFARRLREMEGPAKAGLVKSLKTTPEPLLVRSAFVLPAEQRAAIQKALADVLGAEVQLRFEVAPELVAGIELAGNGQKIGWSISNYLASLQERVAELLEKKAQPETGSP